MVTITGFETRGTQLPVSQLRIFSRLSLMNNTRPSLDKTGSDAMNAAGHYSAAYCILKTVSEHSGHGMVRNPAPPEKRYSNWSHHIKTFTLEEALQMLGKEEEGKAERMKEAENNKAIPAYTTSAGWLGYGEDKMERLLLETLQEGYKYFKLKVGTSLEDEERRLAIARIVISYDQGNHLIVDTNQVWSIPEALEYIKALASFKLRS